MKAIGRATLYFFAGAMFSNFLWSYEHIWNGPTVILPIVAVTAVAFGLLIDFDQ